ncbi:ABC transporter substrate-binding protein [Paenibacillus sp. TSA_86.1]|uniref:ABC transporter substrate-binding protein n=1 Tax=Paenibacillus sp. TSA_86.1 TaxID=3415649 RepID=UPI004045FDEF
MELAENIMHYQKVGSTPTIYRKKPKKIVSLTFNYTASLIALGQIPHIGAVASWMKDRFQEQGMDQFEQRGEHEFIPNLDLIADAHPDLIVGHAPHANLDKLRQIAPTILLPFEELDWQEQLLRLGQITGLETNARQGLTHYGHTYLPTSIFIYLYSSSACSTLL